MTFYKTARIEKRNRKPRTVNIGKACLAMLCMVFTLCSCMGTTSEGDGGKDALLRLTFNPDAARSRALSDGENTITDINVLVFNSAGALTGSAYATFSGGNYTMNVNARTGDGCAIYAIANTGSAAYFKGVATITDFKKKYVALASNPAELGNASKTVMFGKKTGVKINAQTAITAADNFALTRLCSKMSFTIKPATGITVTGYQLCHVPMGSYITDETSTAYYNPPSAVFKDFSTVTVTTSAGTSVSGINYYMYENLAGKGTNVSAETRTATYAPANATYIIVYATGPNWKSTYRIYLGGTGATDYTGYDIPRNYSYPYTIKINGSGVNDVRVTCYPELINTPSASGWTNNGNAASVTSSATATRGDYYFSDGTWGSLVNNPGKTPIAVIFSGSTSTIDKGYGWTHGYAMALTNAANACQWSANTSKYPNLINASEAGATFGSFTYTDYTGTYDTFITNKDGYCETHAINNKYSSTLQNDHPAFYYALRYNITPPGNSSGWYLPSVGQWWDILINLGGMPSTPSSGGAAYFRWYSADKTGDTNDYSSICASNINKYLTAISSKVTPNYFYKNSNEELYWCSSEDSSIDSYDVDFLNGGINVNNSGYGFKDKLFIARPVIAF